MYSDGDIVIVKSASQSGSGNGVMEDDAKCKLISFDNPHVRDSYRLGTFSTCYKNRMVTGLAEGDWIVEHPYCGLTQYFKILGEHIIGRSDYLITNKPIKKHIFNINSPWG
jgi:hypothetical protein